MARVHPASPADPVVVHASPFRTMRRGGALSGSTPSLERIWGCPGSAASGCWIEFQGRFRGWRNPSWLSGWTRALPTGRSGRSARWACGFLRSGIGATESVAAPRGTTGAGGPARLTGALGGFRFDLAYGLFQRQPLAGDFGFGKRRLNTAQLRDQRGARPLIERTTALAWSIRVQAGNSACDQRVIISHFSSILVRAATSR